MLNRKAYKYFSGPRERLQSFFFESGDARKNDSLVVRANKGRGIVCRRAVTGLIKPNEKVGAKGKIMLIMLMLERMRDDWRQD